MSEKFLYQINFNREKYPEVCAELEAAKERTGGIAWYLRKLIEKDIAAKRNLGWEEPVIPVQQQFSSPPKQVKPIKEEKVQKEEPVSLPDDNGGFM